MGKVRKSLFMVDVGFEPTTPKNHGLSTTPFLCLGINGVLVRLTPGKTITNGLPKLSLITLFPPETAG